MSNPPPSAPPPQPQTPPPNPPTTTSENTIATINGTLNKVKTLLENQGAHNIPPYYGDPKLFNIWVKRVEKQAILSGADDAHIKNLAYQTSDGPISDWIRRRITSATYAHESWDLFKASLAQRFAEVSDPQFAFTLLKRERQRSNEPVVMWAERLINLINSAFLNQTVNSDLIDRQCIGFFIDGLISNSLKFKLIRANPDTLQKAIDTAVEEENLQRRFELRCGRSAEKRDYNSAFQTLRNRHRQREDVYPMNQSYPPPSYDSREIEPMEVDHSRHRRPCPRCRTYHSKSNPCATRLVNVVETPGPVNRFQPPMHCRKCNRRDHNTMECPFVPNQSPPPCRNCNRFGHPQSQCPFPPVYRPPVCFNCKQTGHWKNECRSPYVPSTHKGCHNCGQANHMSRNCPHVDHRTRNQTFGRRPNFSSPRGNHLN